MYFLISDRRNTELQREETTSTSSGPASAPERHLRHCQLLHFIGKFRAEALQSAVGTEKQKERAADSSSLGFTDVAER